MKIVLLIQAALMLALPGVQYSFIAESVPFYYYDGIDYTVAFRLPETYFVAIEEEGEEYDRVTYLDLSGYIKHGSCEKTDYEPVTKYPTTGRLELKKTIASVFVYSSADCKTVVTSVTNADKIFLYGESGTENVYYCRVTGASGAVRGYIAGEGVTVYPPDENDVQAVAPMPDPEPEPEPGDKDGDETADNMPFPVEIILIVSLAVPAFLLVFLLTAKKPKS